MLDEDQDVRDALWTELAGQAPPVGGGLAEVVSRGRRLRRTRQVGTALAVVAVLAGTAAVAVAFSGPTKLPPADPGPTTAGAAWPRADLPARTPYGTWTPAASALPPAGRPVESAPLCDSPDTAGRNLNNVRADVGFQRQLVVAAAEAAGGATVGEFAERHQPPTRSATVDSYTYTADITDANGTGSLAFSIGTFTGDPRAAADEQAFDEFNCDPPKRHVLNDSTVLQIYATRPSEPFQSLTQTLRIYRPDGTLYTLAVRNFGSPDFAPNPDQPEIPKRVGAGRESLPLSEAQLADLGLAIIDD
jgi:hypothetical protein